MEVDELGDESSGGRGRKKGFANRDLAKEILRRNAFEEKAGSARLEGFEEVLVEVVGGQHDDSGGTRDRCRGVLPPCGRYRVTSARP